MESQPFFGFAKRSKFPELASFNFNLLYTVGRRDRITLPGPAGKAARFFRNPSIISLPEVVFYWQFARLAVAITFMCEVIDKSKGDLHSSNSNHFLLRPPWSISIARLFFEVSTSIFCVFIWPRQSFHTVCFLIFLRLS